MRARRRPSSGGISGFAFHQILHCNSHCYFIFIFAYAVYLVTALGQEARQRRTEHAAGCTPFILSSQLPHLHGPSGNNEAKARGNHPLLLNSHNYIQRPCLRSTGDGSSRPPPMASCPVAPCPVNTAVPAVPPEAPPPKPPVAPTLVPPPMALPPAAVVSAVVPPKRCAPGRPRRAGRRHRQRRSPRWCPQSRSSAGRPDLQRDCARKARASAAAVVEGQREAPWTSLGSSRPR